MELFVIVFAGLCALLAFRGIKAVPQGRHYTIERFGRYERTLEPGLHFIIPFADRIGAKLSMMESMLEVSSQEIIIRDNVLVKVDGTVFYQVVNAARAAYEVRNIEAAILDLTVTSLRTIMDSMVLGDLLSERDGIGARLLAIMDKAAGPWGIKINRIEIRDIAPPRDLADSTARRMMAGQGRHPTVQRK